MSYTKIKSEFIKNKLKGLTLNEKNREYIDNLIKLERVICGENYGMATTYIRYMGNNRYPVEYEAIYKELRPEVFRRIKEYEQKEKEKQKIEKQREKLEEKQARNSWLKAGGKIVKAKKKKSCKNGVDDKKPPKKAEEFRTNVYARWAAMIKFRKSFEDLTEKEKESLRSG